VLCEVAEYSFSKQAYPHISQFCGLISLLALRSAELVSFAEFIYYVLKAREYSY
jgi:hypothetical protein